MNKKIIATVGACALCVGLGVAGTLAWLTDTTDEVKNTFTTSDIDITLTESNVNDDDSPNTNSYQMIPGFTITKDPKVTVNEGSEDCWLFVKVEKSSNFDTFMTYTIADGWTELDGAQGVYYRSVMKNDTTKSFSVLEGNTVSVKNVKSADMNGLNDNNKPTLTFTAYATQYYSTNNTAMTPQSAWDAVKSENTGA